MLTRVEALNFRCLRYVSRPLDRFHVLVGPNASGKTTFLDVVGFVIRLLNELRMAPRFQKDLVVLLENLDQQSCRSSQLSRWSQCR